MTTNMIARVWGTDAIRRQPQRAHARTLLAEPLRRFGARVRSASAWWRSWPVLDSPTAAFTALKAKDDLVTQAITHMFDVSYARF